MKIVAPRKDLLPLLERASGVADRKSAVPVLSNVLLSAEGRTLRVSATDLYLGMSGTCDADITTAGAITLPARDLFERVKMMPDGPISIEVKEGAQGVVSAVGAKRRYVVRGLPGNDFPLLPKPDSASSKLDLDAELLATLIKRTAFSISSDETRPHVNSACVEWYPTESGKKSRVVMVTTDGHRLSKYESDIEYSGVQTTLLIPAKAVAELEKFVSGIKGEVAIARSKATVFFTSGNMTFSAKLVDAQFPPYNQVIPVTPGVAAKVNRAAFHAAIKAVQLASSDKAGGVMFVVKPGLIAISAESAESGSGADEVAAEYGGPVVKVGLNAKYVIDVLGAMDDEEIEFRVSGELDPVVIMPTAASKMYTAVVMPMRLD